MKYASIALCALLLPSVAAAQAAWTQLAPATQPGGLTGMFGASDGSGLLLFGGKNAAGRVDGTWRFDGTNWTQITTTTQPSPRQSGGSAYDLLRNKLVIFGGETNTGYSNETWEFDGTTWTQMNPATSPPARMYNDAMTFDVVRGVSVLYGGRAVGGAALGDTWTWDGTNWTQMSPATNPNPGQRYAMTFDWKRGVAVMLENKAGKTWTWNGLDWTLVPVTYTPYETTTFAGGANSPGIAYDQLRDRVVLFGGGALGGPQARVFEFDGSDWAERAPFAKKRLGVLMDFVPALGKVIRFGGWAGGWFDPLTWEYQTNAFGSFSTNGTGCMGNNGVPTIHSNTPWIGETVNIEVGSLAANASPFVMLGFNATTWSGGNLPFSFGVLGAMGCDLQVSNDFNFSATKNGSVGTLPLAVPNDARLIGVSIFVQGFVLDVGANPLGLVVSPRGDLTFGAL